MAWARNASWAEIDEFIICGGAKGFPWHIVQKLVKIHEEKRMDEEDKVRQDLERRQRVQRKEAARRTKNDKLAKIHNEFSNFTEQYVFGLTPSEFEEFVGRLFEAFGYRSELVGGNRDNGIDLKVFVDDTLFAIVQCKRYLGKNIGSPEIRDLMGAFASLDAKQAYFFTTSEFTPAALEAAKNYSYLHLFDLAKLKRFVADAKKSIESDGEVESKQPI